MEKTQKEKNLLSLIKPDQRCLIMGIDSEKLVETINGISLNDNVPEPIHEQIEVCKKLCVQSYFVYEFATVAMERSFMIIESALKAKYAQLGNRVNRYTTLGPLMDWAIKEKIITDVPSEILKAVKKMRNIFAHPIQQSIDTPSSAINMLKKNVELINSIFKNR